MGPGPQVKPGQNIPYPVQCQITALLLYESEQNIIKAASRGLKSKEHFHSFQTLFSTPLAVMHFTLVCLHVSEKIPPSNI